MKFNVNKKQPTYEQYLLTVNAYLGPDSQFNSILNLACKKFWL